MRCPYCGNGIEVISDKCPHCHMLLPHKKEKWYFSPFFLIVSFLSVGPLALPLVWLHPRIKRRAKVVITLVVVLITYVFIVVSIKFIGVLAEYYSLLTPYNI